MRRKRRGLVLGAGGVLGAAWTIGALDALAETEGFDPHEADIIVGTSAGSVLAALLGSGFTAADLLHHQRGMPLSREIALEWSYDESTGGSHPSRPRLAAEGDPAAGVVVHRHHPDAVPRCPPVVARDRAHHGADLGQGAGPRWGECGEHG